MDAEFCSWQKVAAGVLGVVAGETVKVVPSDAGLALVSDT